MFSVNYFRLDSAFDRCWFPPFVEAGSVPKRRLCFCDLWLELQLLLEMKRAGSAAQEEHEHWDLSCFHLRPWRRRTKWLRSSWPSRTSENRYEVHVLFFIKAAHKKLFYSLRFFWADRHKDHILLLKHRVHPGSRSQVVFAAVDEIFSFRILRDTWRSTWTFWWRPTSFSA